MSVTYGAGGGTSDYTVGIAAGIQQQYGVDVLAHLTCASSTRDHVAQVLEHLKEKGIQNVLALRGDIPEGGAPAHDYQYAAPPGRAIKAHRAFCRRQLERIEAIPEVDFQRESTLFRQCIEINS